MFSIEASLEERTALAKRFNLLSVDALAARGILLASANNARVSLKARLIAEVTQQCVVSLKPAIQRIDVDFVREYDPEATDEWANMCGGDAENPLSVACDDYPDPIDGGVIDVGEAVAEQLALELDPFPRIAGANVNDLAQGSRHGCLENGRINSFAALAAVKAKSKNKR